VGAGALAALSAVLGVHSQQGSERLPWQLSRLPWRFLSSPSCWERTGWVLVPEARLSLSTGVYLPWIISVHLNNMISNESSL